MKMNFVNVCNKTFGNECSTTCVQLRVFPRCYGGRWQGLADD